MKHGRHASDYDKVRKSAGFAAPRYQAPAPEFPEPDATAERSESRARVQGMDDDFKARMTTLSEHETAQQEARKKEADVRTARANLSVMTAEYRNARVVPPFTDANGHPKFSLHFLFRMGWSIQMVGSENVLVSPIAAKGK